jgi:hypothetical protein
VLDRYLHHLRTPPAQPPEQPQTAHNLTKHYYPLSGHSCGGRGSRGGSGPVRRCEARRLRATGNYRRSPSAGARRNEPRPPAPAARCPPVPARAPPPPAPAAPAPGIWHPAPGAG